MKKAFAYILALLLLLSITACRSGNGDNEYSDPYEPETNEYENSDEFIVPGIIKQIKMHTTERWGGMIPECKAGSC